MGVILYEMMTGDTPFAGGTPATILERHLTEDAVSPSARRPNSFIPIAFERAIMRALEKDPAKRHASAASFAAALAAATPTDGAESTRAVQHPGRGRVLDGGDHVQQPSRAASVGAHGRSARHRASRAREGAP